ncbi:hypothetical protein ACH4LN_07435 [Streptomyces albus]|uniref:Uncharacterized protein n=1 Tax=Streptomyces albus TaxID=1888 RepID=A0A6C1C893_9ACTN|nr:MULTISPECIES: hypothetical protein [Streptomyces]KPC96867.1 hypothetical protein ADL27_00590 [Streptomyces sp. NRRL F-6602]EPD90942.1 hypothetical protein HMPREF1486_05322 [Streptomyces sp. HPH0547]QID37116.1 hypothetical protein G3260_003465 [Streptomyces albus]TGG81402.1 hypothetical protein D8771_18385 [Streptomyces albus]UVN55956.1 hypothetical protein NR995_16560 [Streptomyces albus]
MTAGTDLRVLRAAIFAAVCVTVSAAGHLLAADAAIPPGPLALGFGCVFLVALALAGRERSLPGIAALLAVGQFALHLVFSLGSTPPAGGSGQAAGGSPGHPGGVRALAGKLLCNHSAMGMSEAEARRVVARAGLDPQAAAAATGGAEGAGHAGHAGVHAVTGTPFPETPLDCLRDAARAAVGMFDAPMLLGHLCAALLLGLLLRRGEAALWRLVRLSADTAAAADELVAALALGRALAYVRALHAGLLPRTPPRSASGPPRDEVAPPSVTLEHSLARRGPPARRADAFLLAA